MNPFRELFVELSEQAMAAARAAIEKALEPSEPSEPEPRHRPSVIGEMLAALNPEMAVSHVLAGELGWSRIVSTYRTFNSCDVVVVAKLRCGHLHRIVIDERWLEDSASPHATLFDSLYRKRADRSCYCVQGAS